MPNRDDIPYFSGPRSEKPEPPAPEPSPAPEPAPDAVAGSSPSSELDAAPTPESPEPQAEADGSPPIEPDAESEPEPPAPDPGAGPRRLRKAAMVAVGVLGVLVVLFGVWFALYALRTVPTPFIVARTPAAAEGILGKSGLAAGNARLLATREFASGLIMGQSPQTPTRLKPGSPVNVVVATSTINAMVPDVALVDQPLAEQVLRGTLFIPVTIQVYSRQVRVGSIVSQLPRGGDMAFTGSPVYLAVSMGPGTMGPVVPALVGKPYKAAESLLTTQSIFPRKLMVDAPGVAADTVVDQLPPPGTIVPVGSIVAVSLALPTQ